MAEDRDLYSTYSRDELLDLLKCRDRTIITLTERNLEGVEIKDDMVSTCASDHSLKKKDEMSTLSNTDILRYSRQLILPELGMKSVVGGSTTAQSCTVKATVLDLPHGGTATALTVTSVNGKIGTLFNLENPKLKLRNASVLIVGAGGLGCPSAIYLAAAGIGRLGVIDYDEVELSNLHRQILHSESKVGVKKSLSVTQSCKSLNSSVEYEPYHLQLDSTNALDIIQRYDIVLDATDNVATRYLLNDACVLTGKPLVSGSALRFEGQLTVYNCEKGPCYRCLFPKPPPPETVTNCSDGGVVGVVPGIIGSLQALEAIKIAAGIGTSYRQRLLLFDAIDGTFRSVKLRPRSAECVVCGDNPEITRLIDYQQFCGATASDKDKSVHVLAEASRITPKAYAQMLSDGTPHILVDVRPQIELDICQLPHPAINIPLTSITKDVEAAKDLIAKACSTVNAESSQKESTVDLPIVCVCRRGNDSQFAVQMLQKHMSASTESLNISDIRGGLLGWSKQVDLQFPVY